MKHGRVLLAGAHMGLLGGIRGLLNDLFEAVLMVTDEESLLEALACFVPELVVVDVSLPRLGVENVARLLQKRFPGGRFIVLSSYSDPMTVREIMDAGAGGFVLMRAACTDLVPAVEEVMRGGSYVSPASRVRTAGDVATDGGSNP